ncbi:hypothetical protein BDV41DRAFT_589092 [Aspergillus transmontanensis]|uniref:Rhodopsin domain-containing protein n=1 Tax=Aspergillus transmontanensis TaxID=1034304 RepID=A0A5N6VUN9_9EURO|nr:hypothetical protein BDV41DRAFT_589092 [Aspergillus transmontanensis]
MGANARGSAYVSVSSVLVAVSTVIVAIRIWTRWIQSTLGPDDYSILLSVILMYSMLGEAVVWAQAGGLGKHMADLTIKEQITFQRCFFANEISYTFLVPSIKVSILLLYRRIFSVGSFRALSYMVLGLVTSWCFAVFITILIQCRPIQFNWDKSLEGTCIDAKQFFFGNAISNLLIDVILLALPIPMVLQLQLQLPQKLTVIGIFLLGGFVCFASIMWIVTLKVFEDRDTSCSSS